MDIIHSEDKGVYHPVLILPICDRVIGGGNDHVTTTTGNYLKVRSGVFILGVKHFAYTTDFRLILHAVFIGSVVVEVTCRGFGVQMVNL